MEHTKHEVRLAALFHENSLVVQVPNHDLQSRPARQHFGLLCLVSHEQYDGVLGVLLEQAPDGVAAYVSGRTGHENSGRRHFYAGNYSEKLSDFEDSELIL